MKEVDVVVIGGGPPGLTAAISAKRNYPDRSVLLLRWEPISLIPCGIPYIFGPLGTPDRDMVTHRLLQMNDVEYQQANVTRIDPGARRLELEDGSVIAYERLILVTGSDPAVPPIPGVERDNVFSIQKERGYLKRMLKSVEAARDVVIIGGGFIGVELAEEIKRGRECSVSVVEMMEHCLSLAFDQDLGIEAEAELSAAGVQVLTGTRVEEIMGNGSVSGVRLSSGETLIADAVILAVGAVPRTGLARDAGIELTKRGQIVVDGHQRSSVREIFASGDCAAKRSYFTGAPSGLMLASVGSFESRIAAMNLYKDGPTNPGAVGVFSTRVGGKVFCRAGLLPGEAGDTEVMVGEFQVSDRHPGEMPGTVRQKVRLVFRKIDRTLIGGQVRGGTTAGEVINLIATAIQMKASVEQLVLLQIGTQPSLTSSSVTYAVTNAAEKVMIAHPAR